MPADLKVVAVRLPPVLRAPCPVVIPVSIRNDGTDPADPVPYDVTIALGSGDASPVLFEAIVQTLEEQRLTPGRTIVVPVTVRFPCTSPVVLQATVDRKLQIPNNARSAPSQTLTVNPTAVPWLTVALRVGIRDAAGFVTFDPDGFCPGKPLVAEVVITNRGCRASQPSMTQADLEDAGAAPRPTTLRTQTYLVPALNPGASHTTLLAFATPNSAAGTSGTLGVRVRADARLDNPDQCNRTQLTGWVEKPFAAGSPPRLVLTVGGAGVIRPGEVPALSWQVRNDCSEIGTADVRILFSGSEIYKATLAIPLRATVEETLAPAVITIPAAIANTFWTTGLKSLELEVTGNGPGGGPYQISVPLNVIPEPIDDTWWTWGPSPAAAAWKSTYAITGTFANRGLVNMTVTELTAREHPTDVMGPGSDLIVAPTSSVPTVVALPGGSVSALWLRNQTWTWLARGTFVEVGPRSRTFSYTAIFSVMDTFGNVYPMVGSAPTTATVTVPFSKLNSHSEGITLVSFGLAFLVAAVVAAAAGGPYGWIGAVIIAAAGMALIIKGTFDLYDAYDPPVPDFREHGPKLPDPAAWKLPVAEDPELHALGTLALLIARLVSTQLRARQHADRAWAAFVDRDESARTERRDAIRNEHETLRRLVRATADAADEARESWEKLLKGVRTLPTHEALLQMVSRVADEIGLTGSERALVEGRLQAADREMLRQALQHVRDQGTGSIGDLARRFYESIGARLSGYEHLR